MKEKFLYNSIISLLDQNLTFNLAESTSVDLKFGDLLDDELISDLKQIKLGYGTSKGSKELRKLIAAKLDVSEESVLITNGTSSAIFYAIFSLCDSGDEVITVNPNFPPTLDVISAVGAVKKMVEISFDHRYQFKSNDFENLLSEKTKLIILVSPHNPSGTIISDENVTEIIELMKVKSPNAYLLIDETYREATYGDDVIRKSYANLSSRILAVASLSKCHGTPGLRLGWISCHNQQLLQQLTLAKLNTVISCSPLDERIAVAVIKKEQEIFSERKKLLATAVKIVENWVDSNDDFIDWVKPECGALCCIRLKNSSFSEHDIELFYKLLPENNLQLGLGEWFGENKRIFRLGFGYLPLVKLEMALKELTQIFQKIVRLEK
jgi:aspartate/methionine/tyrosine aminotransferase